MNKEAFLAELAEVLEVNKADLTEDFPLNDSNWDSLAVLATIALIDEQLGITAPTTDLAQCTSVGELLN
ncbi:MAG: acyl carrier protein, partial [Armatimonadota bacterium]|nr:acyl carrier protein [Armatimonadota bacterium]